jgi:hypothetical protein
VASYSFRLAAAGSPEITVESSMVRGVRVSVDGRPVPRSRERGRPYWSIPLAGGGERRLFVTGTVTGLRALTGDEDIPLERRLAWWELLLAFLPLTLVTVGGLIGGLVGGAGTIVGLWVMRRPWPPAARAIAGLAVFALAAASWWIVREGLVALFYSG